MFNKIEKRQIRQAYKASVWLDERMNSLYNDPMTHAMGVDTGDFYADWSRRHRRMIAAQLKNPSLCEQARTLLLDSMDRYMP
jgi:hypothetical protein